MHIDRYISVNRIIDITSKDLFNNYKKFLIENHHDKYDIKQIKFCKNLYAEIIKENLNGIRKSHTRDSVGGTIFTIDLSMLSNELKM